MTARKSVTACPITSASQTYSHGFISSNGRPNQFWKSLNPFAIKKIVKFTIKRVIIFQHTLSMLLLDIGKFVSLKLSQITLFQIQYKENNQTDGGNFFKS